jgi:hypothetical protein
LRPAFSLNSASGGVFLRNTITTLGAASMFVRQLHVGLTMGKFRVSKLEMTAP